LPGSLQGCSWGLTNVSCRDVQMYDTRLYQICRGASFCVLSQHMNGSDDAMDLQSLACSPDHSDLDLNRFARQIRCPGIDTDARKTCHAQACTT
jgi:hypothetical protein